MPDGAELPRYSVAQETTPDLAFADALTLYAETGAQGIGIDIATLSDDEEDLARFAGSGLQATFCSLPASTVLPVPEVTGIPASGLPDDPAVRVEMMCAGVRRLAPFRPLGCVVAPGPCAGYAPDEAREIVVAALRRVAREAAGFGMVVALEPIHPSLAHLFSFINDLPAAAALIADVAEPNLGVIVDFWHLGDNPTLPADISAHADLIALVHLNDRPPQPRSWCDRLLPGDGTTAVPDLLGELERVGYRGWYELEVISDDGRFGNAFADSLWRLEAAEMLRRGRARFAESWEQRARV